MTRHPLSLIFHTRNLWWYCWIPGKKGSRAITVGNIILLSPYSQPHDLDHELIHSYQAYKEPFIHPLLYFVESLRHGYRKNKYEVEAYEKAKNPYVEG